MCGPDLRGLHQRPVKFLAIAVMKLRAYKKLRIFTERLSYVLRTTLLLGVSMSWVLTVPPGPFLEEKKLQKKGGGHNVSFGMLESERSSILI
jgi:hypothetical protein